MTKITKPTIVVPLYHIDMSEFVMPAPPVAAKETIPLADIDIDIFDEVLSDVMSNIVALMEAADIGRAPSVKTHLHDALVAISKAEDAVTALTNH